MNRKLRYYEKIGMLIAIIKNDYPSKISKDFSSKIMSSISSENTNSLTGISEILLKALITIDVLSTSPKVPM